MPTKYTPDESAKLAVLAGGWVHADQMLGRPEADPTNFGPVFEAWQTQRDEYADRILAWSTDVLSRLAREAQAPAPQPHPGPPWFTGLAAVVHEHASQVNAELLCAVCRHPRVSHAPGCIYRVEIRLCNCPSFQLQPVDITAPKEGSAHA